jgi:cell division cycle 14
MQDQTEEKGDPKPMLHAVFGKVYIAQYVSSSVGKFYRCFEPPDTVQYYPLCDDFGPMNISSVLHFVESLDYEIDTYPSQKIIYIVQSGRRAVTNGVFLLGSYMLLKLKWSALDISQSFSWVDSKISEPYRDATFVPADYELTTLDCWQALERAVSCNWVSLCPPTSSLSGAVIPFVEVNEYVHYDDPLNGDLHEVLPGKFVAFKGPKDLSGAEFKDDSRGYRHFSPLYYVDIFRELGVTDVIRLNEPEYDACDFTDWGIAHHDLEFEDCTSPPDRVVAAFLRVADAAPGLVAIHCKAGLGRTGTLIALYLMRSHGFTAREAMGWLRIMRPGSVIGEQQHYLCAVDGPPHPPPALIATPPSAPHAPLSPVKGPVSPKTLRAHGPGGSPQAANRNLSPPNPPQPPHFDPLGYPLRAAAAAAGTPQAISAAPLAPASAAAAAAQLAAQVAAGMERRGTVRGTMARLPAVSGASPSAGHGPAAAAPAAAGGPGEVCGRGPTLPCVRAGPAVSRQAVR